MSFPEKFKKNELPLFFPVLFKYISITRVTHVKFVLFLVFEIDPKI